jgi:dihydroorotate dehydrogenase
MGLYTRALLPLLHRLDPETAHRLTLALAGALQSVPLALRPVAACYSRQDPRLRFTWKGIAFRSPVGLAAGADKDARALRFFEAMGLGFIEAGTVTPRPQPGNPRPRIFRLPREQAMVNRLGFPSQGAERVARRLARTKPRRTPVGVNLGKNAETPLDGAAEDYIACLERFYGLADYFVVNVSSPNTLGLTSLQARPALEGLLRPVLERRAALAREARASPKPLLVKVSPDLTDGELDDVAAVCLEHGMDGLVAVNTSTDPALRTPASAGMQGGLSGRPLHPRALQAVARVRSRAPSDFLIIGVGGVWDAESAWDLIRAGANAVQFYTGLVYQGPSVASRIHRGLAQRLEQANLSNIVQAVGGGR